MNLIFKLLDTLVKWTIYDAMVFVQQSGAELKKGSLQLKLKFNSRMMRICQ